MKKFRYAKYSKRGRPPKHFFPIRYWLGKYESYILTLYGNRRFRFVDKQLEKFLDYFNGYYSLHNITSAVVYEYRVLRRRDGWSDATIRINLSVVEQFFQTLISHWNLPLKNPCKGPSPSEYKQQKPLTLDEFRALLAAIDDVRVRNYLRAMVHRTSLWTGLSPALIGMFVHKAAVTIGLPWITLRTLRRSLLYTPWLRTLQSLYDMEGYEEAT